MQSTAHMTFERGIDHLMLSHPCLALESGRGDHGGEMIVIACQILDLDIGVGKRLLDIGFDFAGFHAHDIIFQFVTGISSRLMKRGNQPSCAARSFANATLSLLLTIMVSPPVLPSSVTGI